jgi:hypothetical protein
MLPAQELRPTTSLAATVLAAADLDGSGLADILLDAGTHVRWLRDPGLLGAGSSTVLTNQRPKLGAAGPRVLDLDGDGWRDILFKTETSSGTDLLWLRALGNGGFAGPQVLGSFGGSLFVDQHGVGDFDGNGLLDLAVLDGPSFHMPTIEVLTQTVAGSFVRSTLVVAATLTVGDFDGDGFADLVAGGGAIYRGSPSGLVYLRHAALPSQVSLVSGDVNGDGCDDIVWQLGSVTLGSPTAVLVAGSVGLPSQPVVLAVEVADLDGDGHNDVVALQGGAVPGFGQLQWNRWRAATGPTSPQMLIPQTMRGVLADLDGDGDADFLADDGQRYENLASYGGPCGAPMTLSSDPVAPGSPWQLTIRGAPASTLAAILFGTADQVAACGTLVAPTSLLGTLPLLVTGTAGSATQSVDVPAWFAWGPFFLQAIALDPAGGYQRFGVSLSSSGGRAISIF